jgi:hypothetical protein
MAALPKSSGATVRRNVSRGRRLPPAEPFEVPQLPKRSPAWLRSTRDWWSTLWRSPMAAAYLEADVEPLMRLAELVDARAHGKLTATGLLAMTALEDRYGLSPKARRALGWEVETAEPEQEAKPVKVPKLRVVDDA